MTAVRGVCCQRRFFRVVAFLFLFQVGAAPLFGEEGPSPTPKASPSAIRIWTAILTDAKTHKPVEGVTVEVKGAKAGEEKQQMMVLTSDAEGRVQIPLAVGQGTSVHVTGAGWWAGGLYIIGEFDFDKDGKNDTPADPAKPATIDLWKGTVVTGRLLKPDDTPASGMALNVGVYINDAEWKKRLGMDLSWNSWDHGEWPNWDHGVRTGDDGSFSVTVPPPDARSWIRLGTTGLGFSAIDPVNVAPGAKQPAIAEYAPFEFEVPQKNFKSINVTLRLKSGVILKGRVLDADGKPLGGVDLFTSGAHGPYAGRRTTSAADGSYEFQPVGPGKITLSPDARIRDRKGEVHSRDVQAVFVKQEITIPDSGGPMELNIQALPHVNLRFEWVDRRAKKGPVSYYGEFPVTGRIKREGAEPVWWRGETEKTTENGRELLFVKVPTTLTEATLQLATDTVVTASYEDDGTKSGPGRVLLGDVTDGRRRVIYGDEPQNAK